jgi:hypothetical protein
MKGGRMPQIEIAEENLAGLQKWAEYFSLPLQQTVDVIIATALEDLQDGSPLFFNALDPPPEDF